MWRNYFITHCMTLCSKLQMLVHTIYDWCQCHDITRFNYMDVCFGLLILARHSEVGHDFMK